MSNKTKKVRKPKAKPGKPKSKCLLTYTEDSAPRAKLFNSEKEMHSFIKEWSLKYSGLGSDEGYWFDLCVTGITGKAVSLDEGYNPFTGH
jgi:hypothetical protein